MEKPEEKQRIAGICISVICKRPQIKKEGKDNVVILNAVKYIERRNLLILYEINDARWSEIKYRDSRDTYVIGTEMTCKHELVIIGINPHHD